MSALPPKADMCSALAYVCFGPIADISQSAAPFIIESGTGSEVRQPLRYAIVGGLPVSQILSLYTHRSSTSLSTDCAGVLRQ